LETPAPLKEAVDIESQIEVSVPLALTPEVSLVPIKVPEVAVPPTKVPDLLCRPYNNQVLAKWWVLKCQLHLKWGLLLNHRQQKDFLLLAMTRLAEERRVQSPRKLRTLGKVLRLRLHCRVF
jgi:hypothetical protein